MRNRGTCCRLPNSNVARQPTLTPKLVFTGVLVSLLPTRPPLQAVPRQAYLKDKNPVSAIKNIFYLLGSARRGASLTLGDANERIKDVKDIARIKWTRISIERLENSLNSFKNRESEGAEKVRKQLLVEYETLISYLTTNVDINAAACSMLRVYGSDDLSPYVNDALLYNYKDEETPKKMKAFEAMKTVISLGRSPWAARSHNMRTPEA